MRGWDKQGNTHKGNCISAILNNLVTKSYRTYVCVRVFVIYCIFCCFAYFCFHSLHPVYTLTYPSSLMWPVHLISTRPYPTQPYPTLPYPILLLTHKILFTHRISQTILPFVCSSHLCCTLSIHLVITLSYTTLYSNVLVLLIPLFFPALPFLVTVHLKSTHTHAPHYYYLVTSIRRLRHGLILPICLFWTHLNILVLCVVYMFIKFVNSYKNIILNFLYISYSHFFWSNNSYFLDGM
jgi:hypothetical protein